MKQKKQREEILNSFKNHSLRKAGVTPGRSNPNNMCHDWLEHLIGLKVVIPENWWEGCKNSKELYTG